MGFLSEVLFLNQKHIDYGPIIIPPTAPTDINVVVSKNTATITFTKGNGIATEINKKWVGLEDSFDESTIENTFVLSNLAYGTHYEFVLRTISENGLYAYSEIYSFDTEIEVIEKVNIFTNNFNPYSSSGNLNGIGYSSYAKGDAQNRTITHTLDGFSSTYAFIFSGFEIGKSYIYSFDVTGNPANTFIQVECLTQTNGVLYNSDGLIGEKKVEFKVVANTYKLRIRVGTSGGHIGSSTFSNISIVEK